jgi:hypothetical protein
VSVKSHCACCSNVALNPAGAIPCDPFLVNFTSNPFGHVNVAVVEVDFSFTSQLCSADDQPAPNAPRLQASISRPPCAVCNFSMLPRHYRA